MFGMFRRRDESSTAAYENLVTFFRLSARGPSLPVLRRDQLLRLSANPPQWSNSAASLESAMRGEAPHDTNQYERAPQPPAW